MKPGLLIMLIIIGNAALYWVFFGKKKFDQKFEVNHGREDTSRRSP